MVEQFNQHLGSKANVDDVDFGALGQRLEDVMRATYDQLFQTTRISAYMLQYNSTILARDSELKLSVAVKRGKSQIKLAGEMAMTKQSKVIVPTNSVTIQGDNNVVVAGNPNSHVELQFRSTTVKELTAALVDLKAAIGASDVPASIKGNLIEVVDDCSKEVTKHTPNRTRFTGMLSGLATTIQTTASLAPAYSAFKSAAALAGITLP